MRYEIQGDTLPVVICYLDGGEKMITEKRSHELDVSKHAHGDFYQWRHRKGFRTNVFR